MPSILSALGSVAGQIAKNVGSTGGEIAASDLSVANQPAQMKLSGAPLNPVSGKQNWEFYDCPLRCHGNRSAPEHPGVESDPPLPKSMESWDNFNTDHHKQQVPEKKDPERPKTENPKPEKPKERTRKDEPDRPKTEKRDEPERETEPKKEKEKEPRKRVEKDKPERPEPKQPDTEGPQVYDPDDVEQDVRREMEAEAYDKYGKSLGELELDQKVLDEDAAVRSLGESLERNARKKTKDDWRRIKPTAENLTGLTSMVVFGVVFGVMLYKGAQSALRAAVLDLLIEATEYLEEDATDESRKKLLDAYEKQKKRLHIKERGTQSKVKPISPTAKLDLQLSNKDVKIIEKMAEVFEDVSGAVEEAMPDSKKGNTSRIAHKITQAVIDAEFSEDADYFEVEPSTGVSRSTRQKMGDLRIVTEQTDIMGEFKRSADVRPNGEIETTLRDKDVPGQTAQTEAFEIMSRELGTKVFIINSLGRIFYYAGEGVGWKPAN